MHDISSHTLYLWIKFLIRNIFTIKLIKFYFLIWSWSSANRNLGKFSIERGILLGARTARLTYFNTLPTSNLRSRRIVNSKMEDPKVNFRLEYTSSSVRSFGQLCQDDYHRHWLLPVQEGMVYPSRCRRDRNILIRNSFSSAVPIPPCAVKRSFMRCIVYGVLPEVFQAPLL